MGFWTKLARISRTILEIADKGNKKGLWRIKEVEKIKQAAKILEEARKKPKPR